MPLDGILPAFRKQANLADDADRFRVGPYQVDIKQHKTHRARKRELKRLRSMLGAEKEPGHWKRGYFEYTHNGATHTHPYFVISPENPSSAVAFCSGGMASIFAYRDQIEAMAREHNVAVICTMLPHTNREPDFVSRFEAVTKTFFYGDDSPVVHIARLTPMQKITHSTSAVLDAGHLNDPKIAKISNKLYFHTLSMAPFFDNAMAPESGYSAFFHTYDQYAKLFKDKTLGEALLDPVIMILWEMKKRSFVYSSYDDFTHGEGAALAKKGREILKTAQKLPNDHPVREARQTILIGSKDDVASYSDAKTYADAIGGVTKFDGTDHGHTPLLEDEKYILKALTEVKWYKLPEAQRFLKSYEPFHGNINFPDDSGFHAA